MLLRSSLPKASEELNTPILAFPRRGGRNVHGRGETVLKLTETTKALQP
jgi:hypothetical protein